jgi:hypothetical protein
VITPGAVEKPSTVASTAVAQYETLRMAMLGEALPPEARSGLMLFLRRGMWGWARALAVGSVRQEPISARRSNPAEPCERGAIVYVFAAMAMTVNNGERHERVSQSPTSSP